MIGQFNTNKEGTITDDLSSYNPSEEITTLISEIKQDYQRGQEIFDTPLEEFNNKTIIEQQNEDQKRFNSYIPDRGDNPEESWRANTVRPNTRNKIISIAAHVVARMLVPKVFAQNKFDNEDKLAGEIMRSLMKWNMKNSEYEDTFLFAVIAALVNPATILRQEYAQVLMTTKKKLADGTIELTEAVDNVLSGMRTHIIPVDELMINNVYEYEVQRQKCLLRRRYISFDEAQGLYGDIEDFKHVRPGIKTLYSEEEDTFYDQKDDEDSTLVEEVIYYNRREDLEVVLVNGILLSEGRMKHRDLDDNPKYEFAKSGYEPIDEKRFFYYKSAANKLGPDQDVLDTMWRMVIDGTFLSVMPPINVSGENVGSAVIIPGATNYMPEKTTMTPMTTGTNLNAGYNALNSLERSMTESSQDNIRSGIAAGSGGRTAREVLLAEQNARIQLGLFGKMIAKLVKDYGELMMEDIIHHMTVSEVEELTAGETRLKFRTFLLPEELEKGKKFTKKIVFTDEFMGTPMSKTDKLNASFQAMKEQGGMKSDTRLYKVNPHLFSKLKFKLFVDVDEMMPENEQLNRALKLEAYDRMIQNPLVDQESVTRDFLVETFAKGEADSYMKNKKNPFAQLLDEEAPQAQKTPVVSQMTQSPSLNDLVNS